MSGEAVKPDLKATDQGHDFTITDIPKSSWPKLLDELLDYTPEIRLEYHGTFMSSKLLARRVKNDKFSTSLVIEPPDPDLSKEIIGDRRQLKFYALYFKDGKQYYVSSQASIDQYIIYYGFPALILSIMPPIKHYEQATVSYPTKEKPVHITLPKEASTEPLLAKEVSLERIVALAGKETVEVGRRNKSGKVLIELPTKKDLNVKVTMLKNEDGNIILEISGLDKENQKHLVEYLSGEFKHNYESRLEHLITLDKKHHAELKTGKGDHQPTVLIVDDEEDAHLPLVVLLEERNFRIEFANDGSEGVKKARLLKPDIILLDITMPKLNGMGAVRLLRLMVETRNIPVMMITADAEIETVMKTSEYNISGYISKPYNPDNVMARVESVLKGQV